MTESLQLKTSIPKLVRPFSERQFLEEVRRGDLVRVILESSSAQHDWMVFEGFLDGDKPSEYLVGLLTQKIESADIISWQSRLKYLQFDEEGARFNHLYRGCLVYTPKMKGWGERYDLLNAANRWEGNLALGQ